MLTYDLWHTSDAQIVSVRKQKKQTLEALLSSVQDCVKTSMMEMIILVTPNVDSGFMHCGKINAVPWTWLWSLPGIHFINWGQQYPWPWMPKWSLSCAVRVSHSSCSWKNNNNMTNCDAHCHYFNPLKCSFMSELDSTCVHKLMKISK